MITAQATDDRGLVTTSAAVTVTVGPPNARPTVRLNSPANNTPFSAPASVKVVATASDSDGTIARVEFFRDGQLAATATSEPYVATLSDIAAGSHSIYARATDNRGGTTSTTPVTITVATTSLVISSPLPNASIDGATVLVQGRVEALSGSALSVGGSIASIDGFGNFYVTAQLAPGANTITAMLRTVDGNTLTQSVNVNATGTALPYAVTANKRAGLAPLAATFNVVNPTTTGVSFTFNGGGPYSLPAGGALQLSVTYPAGSWVNTFVFSSGQTYQIVVDSRDPARMDQMFRAIWSGMNSALVAGD